MKQFGFLILSLIVLSACNKGLKSDKLYGEWTYVKIDHPNSDDQTDTLGREDLANYQAHIKFIKENKLEIWWEGKRLSYGTFVIQGENIQFTEQLPDGKSRTFPFFVSRLDSKNITFETMGKAGSRVVAIRK